jgi:nucleotide-binding universal stress UspA family protein
MFKHILIPTDGSELAAKAIDAGVALAKEMGAKITGFYAEEPRPVHLHVDGYQVEKILGEELDRRSREYAERCVGRIEKAARSAGVPFESRIALAGKPYEAIIKAAETQKCDAIFMASHGHRGLSGMLLGSVTHGVLTHSKIPVLVFR